MPPILYALWYIAVGLKAAAVLSIALRAARRFPLLLIYLSLSLAKSVFLMSVGMRSNVAYATIYANSTYILGVVQVFVVFESFRRLSDPLPHFERWARRIFFGALAASFAATIAVGAIAPGEYFVHAFSRIVYSAAAVGFLGAWALLPKNAFVAIPVSARRNAITLTLLLLSEAAANWLMTIPELRTTAAQYVNIGGAAVAYAAWAGLLRKDSPVTIEMSDHDRLEAERRSSGLLQALTMLREDIRRSVLGQALGLG